MKFCKYTDDDIKEIYTLVLNGKKPKKLSGHTYGSVQLVMIQMRHWIDGQELTSSHGLSRKFKLLGIPKRNSDGIIPLTPHLTPAHKKRAEWSEIEKSLGIAVEKVVHVPLNQHEHTIDALESAYKSFEEQLLAFVDAESERRSEKKVADLKEQYEKKMADLQVVLSQTQNSSMISILKKRFGSL